MNECSRDLATSLSGVVRTDQVAELQRERVVVGARDARDEAHLDRLESHELDVALDRFGDGTASEDERVRARRRRDHQEKRAASSRGGCGARCSSRSTSRAWTCVENERPFKVNEVTGDQCRRTHTATHPNIPAIQVLKDRSSYAYQPSRLQQQPYRAYPRMQ